MEKEKREITFHRQEINRKHVAIQLVCNCGCTFSYAPCVNYNDRCGIELQNKRLYPDSFFTRAHFRYYHCPRFHCILVDLSRAFIHLFIDEPFRRFPLARKKKRTENIPMKMIETTSFVTLYVKICLRILTEVSLAINPRIIRLSK